MKLIALARSRLKLIASVRPRLGRVCATIVVLLAACVGTDPSPPTTGSLHVTLATSGTNVDPDGYTLLIQGNAHSSTASTGETTVADLAAGPVSVGLSGVAENCTVGGLNPRSVTITAGELTETAFVVSCAALTGAIEITTLTSGPDPDPDGYTYSVDGAAAQTIPANTSIQIAGLAVGNRTLTLAGVADNCAISGAASRTAPVSFGSTASVTFEVTCVARVGTIEVTATTRGRAPDPDGFTVQVDDGVFQNLPANGTLTISNVHEGSRTISLAGVAENCSITTQPTPTIAVAYQATSSINVEALCPGTLAGRILFVGSGPFLFSMAPDGTDREQVTASASDYQQLTVSPTGDAIAYAGVRMDGSCTSVYTLRYDGKNKRQMTWGSRAKWPAWSPDGALIAYVDCDEQTIWTLQADDTGHHLVTPSGHNGDDTPSWSPDGTRFVFAHEGKLGIMNADATGRTTLDLGVSLTLPQWSPDEARILFTGDGAIGGIGNIYTVNPDGSGLTQLTTTGIATQGRWSPDGQRITYTQSGSAAGGVYTMQADGSLQTRISPPSNNDSHPVWVQ